MGEELFVEIKNMKFQPRGDLPGLDISNFSLSAGTVCALIGASGSGKSLLLSLFSGFPPKNWENKKSEEQKFSWFGKEIDFSSWRKISKQMLECGSIFYLPQKFPDSTGGNVETNLIEIVRALSHKDISTEDIKKKAEGECTFFEWEDKWKTPVNKLSGGERKRFEFAARVISSKFTGTGKTIFLMDEPTAGLDYQNSKKIFEAIKNSCNGSKNFAFIVSTHELAFLGECVDTIFHIKKEGNIAKYRLFRKKEGDITKDRFFGEIKEYQKEEKSIFDAFLSWENGGRQQ